MKRSLPRPAISWRQPGWQLALCLLAVQGIEPRKEWRELCPYLVIIKLWKVIGKNYIAIRAMVKADGVTDILPAPEHDSRSSRPRRMVVCKIQGHGLQHFYSRMLHLHSPMDPRADMVQAAIYTLFACSQYPSQDVSAYQPDNPCLMHKKANPSWRDRAVP